MKNFRNAINEKDDEILNLFIKRLLIVLKIFKIKEKNKLKIVDFKREDEILKKVLKQSCVNKLKPYNYLFFLNIFNISKILQYNEILEITEKKQQNSVKSFNFKRFKIFYFNLSKEFLNLNFFLNCRFKSFKTIGLLFKCLKIKKNGLAIVRTKNLNKSLTFLTNRLNFYVNLIFKFKQEFYICFSNKIFLNKGFNLVFLSLIVNFNLKSLLNLNIFLMLKQLKILAVNFKRINKKEVKFFFKLRCSFKKRDSYIQFFKILEINFKNLKILGVFKTIKVC